MHALANMTRARTLVHTETVHDGNTRTFRAVIPHHNEETVDFVAAGLLRTIERFVTASPAVAFRITASIRVHGAEDLIADGEPTIKDLSTKVVRRQDFTDEPRRFFADKLLKREYENGTMNIVTLAVTTYDIPRGAGALYKPPAWILAKKSVAYIPSDDALCGPRALVLAMATDDKRKKFMGRDAAKLTSLAAKLADDLAYGGGPMP